MNLRQIHDKTCDRLATNCDTDCDINKTEGKR